MSRAFSLSPLSPTPLALSPNLHPPSQRKFNIYSVIALGVFLSTAGIQVQRLHRKVDIRLHGQENSKLSRRKAG